MVHLKNTVVAILLLGEDLQSLFIITRSDDSIRHLRHSVISDQTRDNHAVSEELESVYLSGNDLGSGNVAHVGHGDEISKRRHSVRACERSQDRKSSEHARDAQQVNGESSLLTSGPGVGGRQWAEVGHHVVHHAHSGFVLRQRDSHCSSCKNQEQSQHFILSASCPAFKLTAAASRFT